MTRVHFAPVLLHIIVTIVLAGLLTLLPRWAGARELHCGQQIVLNEVRGELPANGLRLKSRSAFAAVASTGFVLNAGPGLQAQPDALTAWQSAIAIWETWLGDDVTVTIDADLIPLSAGVLGETSPQVFVTDYNSIRNAMVSDAGLHEAIATQLPDSTEISLLMPPGFAFNHQLTGTKANLRALGFDMSFDPAADASMNFNSNMLDQFDFDPSDGIDAGKFDFEAIVVHEIGHVLGFMSEVDTVDFYRWLGLPSTVAPRTLDLYRLLPDDGATDFTTSRRVMSAGDTAPNQVLYDGDQDLALSTGALMGDGGQASHWKADELSGLFIGIMDPTIAQGDREQLTTNDLRAFDLIGWDVAPDCNGNGIPDVDDIANGTSADADGDGVPDECFFDCNDNGVADEEEIAAGTSQDCNGNGVPDECEVSLPDCNGNGVPDECDITSGASNDANGNGVPDECEPFAFPEPQIATLADVGNDQGRRVRLTFSASSRDSAGSPSPIVQYEVFRRIDPLPAAIFSEEKAHRAGLLSDATILAAGWDYVTALPAHGEPSYSAVVSTLADSTIAGGMHWTVIFVRAATSDPLVFFDSPPDSGYSVDNLAPEPPQSFSVVYGPSGNLLTWDPPTATDFSSFRIYRDANPIFDPEPTKLVHATPETSWTDAPGPYHYIVTAVDFSGNESVFTTAQTQPTDATPRSAQTLVLHQNHPNPFNPATTLRFALPRAGAARLEVVDASGRRVRVFSWDALAVGDHTVVWDGRDQQGHGVASGVYLYRLQADGRSIARRMMLLR
ncbi:MAG: NF038122 family metalloprotease [Candidatus Latescibacterota bacterium]|nr:MAG: NF038122 family metalloprotease [Candidatus Latescibacterota bacterium]